MNALHDELLPTYQALVAGVHSMPFGVALCDLPRDLHEAAVLLVATQPTQRQAELVATGFLRVIAASGPYGLSDILTGAWPRDIDELCRRARADIALSDYRERVLSATERVADAVGSILHNVTWEGRRSGLLTGGALMLAAAHDAPNVRPQQLRNAA